MDWLDHEQALGYLLVAPVVLLLVGLVAYPFSMAIGYALSDRTLADEGMFVGLENFRNLFESQIYRQTLRNTFIFTAGAVVLKLLMGLGLGLLLNEPFRGRRLFRAAILLPWIVPTVLGTMAWLWMFNANFSVINWVLVHTGLMAQGLGMADQPQLGAALGDHRQRLAWHTVHRDHGAGRTAVHSAGLL